MKNKKLAYEESFMFFSKKNQKENKCPKIINKRKEKFKDISDTKKTNHVDLISNSYTKPKYIATNSSFKSEKEIIADFIEKSIQNFKIPDIKKIEPDNSIKLAEISRSQKSLILAKKYKRYHYIMAKFSRYKHTNLSEKQINFIFSLAKQIKLENELK